MYKNTHISEEMIEDGYSITRNGADSSKKIESKDILSFELEFCTLDMMDTLCGIEPGKYNFKAYLKGEDVFVDFKSYPYSTQELRRSFCVDKSFLSRVQEIADRFDIARHNGFYHEVKGLPDDYGGHIFVDYASGESISASDNESLFMSFEELLEYKRLFESVIPKK